MGFSDNKDNLRKKMRMARSSIQGIDRAKAQGELENRLLNLPAVKHAGTIGVYHAFGGEMSLDQVIATFRSMDPAPRVAFPAVRSSGIMIFQTVDAEQEADFLNRPMDIANDIDPTRLVAASEIDLLFVPGVAFDRSCRRLGQGGGYYDRYLPHLRPDCLTVGIAFDEQIVEEVPCDVHDRRVDYVLTPSEIISR